MNANAGSLTSAVQMVTKGDVSVSPSVINAIDETTKQLVLSMNSRTHLDDQFYSFFLKLLDRLFGQVGAYYNSNDVVVTI